VKVDGELPAGRFASSLWGIVYMEGDLGLMKWMKERISCAANEFEIVTVLT